MKNALFALLFLLPLAATAGWEYYVLNDRGEWEQVSPRDLDLTVPEPQGAAGEDRRVMIIYDRTVEREAPRPRNWVPRVSRDLVEDVE